MTKTLKGDKMSYKSNIDPRLIHNLKLYYPFIANSATIMFQVSDFELTVKMVDGTSILYDDIDKSFRSLPMDSNDMTETECRTEFGNRLYKLMVRKNITQEELSHRTGIHQTLISKYITGKHSPSFYIVDRIAKALGCSMDQFRYF